MVNTPHFDLDIDSTLGGNNASDYVIPSQKAIKDYVDNNTGSTVDQTYDPTSQAAQSGVAIAGAGFLTGINSTMVTNALGYTPYSAANPNNYTSVIESTVSGWGFTKNVGTVTSVNNVSPVNGNVSLTIPTVDQTYDGTSANAQSGVAIAGAKFLKNKSTNTAGTSYIIGGTASGVSNAVCVGSGASTSAYSVVVGQGAKSTALYSTAIGSTADSNSQFGTAIGYAAKARATSAIQLGTGTNTDANTLSIGFSDAATNYQLLDGTTGLIPDARLSSNIARTSAIPTVNNATLTIQKNGTTVNTFSANASSNVTANITVPTQASDIGAQEALVSGTNIKTVNGTSLLGGGNIDTSEVFIATYGVTTFRDVLDAFQDDKEILVKDVDIQNTTGSIFYAKLGVMQILDTPVAFWFSYIEGNSIKRYLLEADNSWSVTNLTAETTNNKVTSISSSSTNAQYPSAKCVYDDLQNRADVDLSNLNSTGQAVIDGQWVGVTATLCQGRTSETSNDKSFDVSAYLPSDSNNYEVLLTGAVTTGTTSGNQARINLKSSIISDIIVICNAQTRTNSSVTAYGSCPLAIGTDREVIVQGWASNTGAYSLYLRGYRRIGTNS